MSNDDTTTPSDEDYKVGYGKPPKQTQFKPGQSGNPKGRSKGTKNLKTELMEMLAEMILVRDGDRTRQVSNQRAFLMALLSRAFKGDAKAAGHLIGLMIRLTNTGEATSQSDVTFDENEIEILQAYETEVRRKIDREKAALPDPADKEREDAA